MLKEDKLSAVLSEFARTMVTNFPIQGILDHLVKRIVEVLPITAAGVTLITAGKAPRYIAASDDSALRFERLQTEVGQGPCLLAYESGEAVAVADLARDDRFPLFGPPAVASGMAAVFTFPLRAGPGGLGALDLYRGTTGPLTDGDMVAAQTLADVAAAYLLNAQAREEASTKSDRFHHSSLHDPLTGLPNRVLLEQRLKHAAQRARRSNTAAAVLFADLDRFKHVNDAYGHHVGDHLLIGVARRLSALVRPGDTLARVSGDEFVFLCEDLSSEADVEVLARRIGDAFADAFALDDLDLTVTASVGVAYSGPGEEISDQLVVKADAAMYQAKRSATGRQIMDLRAADMTRDRTTLEHDLRAAFAENEFQVAYQPVVRLADGLVTGVEALLRWTHRDRGAIAAMSIIAIAEETGLINQVGGWVLDRACRDLAKWAQHYPGTSLNVSVNVSSRQLMSPDFCALVAGVLGATAMEPEALVLEISESVMAEDGERAVTVLADLRELGLRLAIDAFGTGWSSFHSLTRMPIAIVKIDQSLITNLGKDDAGDGLITAAVTNLSHSLGLSVTAEGVETQRQCDEVGELGCDQAQGFFYARPMPASAIAAMLAASRTHSLHLPVSNGVSPTAG